MNEIECLQAPIRIFTTATVEEEDLLDRSTKQVKLGETTSVKVDSIMTNSILGNEKVTTDPLSYKQKLLEIGNELLESVDQMMKELDTLEERVYQELDFDEENHTTKIDLCPMISISKD